MKKPEPDFRILIIDDNLSIHSDFRKVLINPKHQELNQLSQAMFEGLVAEDMLPNFEIDSAFNGLEGLQKIAQASAANKPYALAFVDVLMPPGMDGVEAIRQIFALDHDMQVVICTAYTDYSWEDTVNYLGNTDNLLLLKKPFDLVAVRQLTCALARKWQLIQASRKYSEVLKQQVEERTGSLQKSLSVVKSTLESSQDGILVINNENKIVEYNQKLLKIFQVPKEMIHEKPASALLQFVAKMVLNPTEFSKKIADLSRDAHTFSIEIFNFVDGRIFEVYTQPHMMEDAHVGRVWNIHDVTQRSRLEKDLHHQAAHDFLTGLYNRSSFLEFLQKEICDCTKKENQFAILFFDLDHFKLINDSLSHAVGDDLLCAVAKRLQQAMRNNDIVARLGGDEFVVLIRGVGVSFYPKNGSSAEVLLRNADSAMYRAKENGANNFQIYSESYNQKTNERVDLEAELRTALIEDQLFLCYQPQYNLRENRIIASEALVRWRHPVKGVLLPIDFIPFADEVGLMGAIGERVLRNACYQNKAWQDAGLDPIRITVNFTAQQFKQQDICELVVNVLEETRLSPEYLEIEITEKVLMSNANITPTISALKTLGVSIALDNFGTGYASIACLNKAPIDRLKIDSSFVQTIQNETDDEAIIRAVIAMAASLNLQVLVEGVETMTQMNFLKMQHCAEVQGFYFSYPLSATEMGFLLQAMKLKRGVVQIS